MKTALDKPYSPWSQGYSRVPTRSLSYFNGGSRFTYPPFAALLLIPVAWLSEDVAQVLWIGLDVVAVVMLARLAVRASVRPSWCPPRVWLPVVVTLLAVSAPVASTIHFGQVSLFVTLAAAATRWVSGRGCGRGWRPR